LQPKHTRSRDIVQNAGARGELKKKIRGQTSQRARHWRGDHADAAHYSGMTSRLKEAVDKYKSSKGDYIDCHAWQFTPGSFRTIITQLHEVGLIDLAIDSLYETQRNSLEFAATLARK